MSDQRVDIVEEARGDIEICEKSFGPMPSHEYRELGRTMTALCAEIDRLRNSGGLVAWRWKDSGHRDWHYRVGEPCDLKDREGVVMEPLFLAPEPTEADV